MSIADEIKKLKKLLDEGVITQEEFDKMKKGLIPNTEKQIVEISKDESNNIPVLPIKKKKPFGCLGCFGIIMIFPLIIAVIAMTSEKSEKNTEKNELTEQEESKVYNEKLKPEIDKIMKEFDITHADYWKSTLLQFSEGSLSSTNTYKNLKSGEERYKWLHGTIGDLKGDFLSKENKKLLSEFQNAYQMTMIKRQIAHKDMAKAINESNLKPATDADIQKLMEESDIAMMQAAVKLTQLEVALGIKRKE
ncbi:SHOCT domain-containing protein [Sporosarcina limicola]|uniref:SHOCT domain-containing protein n=1 Tax=Sporosarcina limicola TaxID=34101 RepID=A0A927MMX9_9BACL|nr:SHOCT domain-containing protein [Sporosarcina limicola]MBE1556072.1 hypothetical protein [Sporosarcina limicola]